jgi:hypothetical protein
MYWKTLHAGHVEEDYIGGASNAIFVTKSAVLRSEVNLCHEIPPSKYSNA